MTKGSEFASDIDFIKEFEELRLKQKILIESLNRQKKSKEKELIIEINSKLDFLVKVFKDSENNDFDEQSYLNKNFGELTKKLEEIHQMSSTFDERLKKIESKIIILSKIDEDNKKKEVEQPKKVKSEELEEKDIDESQEAEDFGIIEDGPTLEELDPKVVSKPNEEDSKPIVEPKKVDEIKKSVPESVEKSAAVDDGPPPPDFTVPPEIENNVSQDDKKKGKKWF